MMTPAPPLLVQARVLLRPSPKAFKTVMSGTVALMDVTTCRGKDLGLMAFPRRPEVIPAASWAGKGDGVRVEDLYCKRH